MDNKEEEKRHQMGGNTMNKNMELTNVVYLERKKYFLKNIQLPASLMCGHIESTELCI